MRGDMTVTYKMMQGVDKVNREKLFSLSRNTRARGHPLKLSVGKVRTDKIFLYPACCSSVKLLATGCGGGIWPRFKRELDRFLEEKSITGYKP